MNDRGVVAAAERVADFDELERQQLSTEVHRHLARYGELLGARLGAKTVRRDPPFPGHDLLDGGDGDGGGGHIGEIGGAGTTQLVAQGLTGEVDRDIAMLE
jgi:hypothetical protein